MNKTSKICIVIPYFGKWPKWINYFLYSCKFNPSIDWMFFTDCGLPDITSENLIFHQMTLHEFNKLASAQLVFELLIQNPYKICDLKPAFGIIFQDFINEYDFWGYGDIDLVYGNIRSFINENVLSKFDVVTFHPDFVPGHFCLLRNNNIVNTLFRESPIYKTVFQEDRMFSFAEAYYKKGIRIKSDTIIKNKKRIYMDLVKTLLYKSSFIKNFFSQLKHLIIKKEQDVCYDFSSIIRHAETKNQINVFRNKLYIDDIELMKNRVKEWEILWENGKLFFKKQEIIYFHFQFFKFSKKLKFVDQIRTSNFFKIIKY